MQNLSDLPRWVLVSLLLIVSYVFMHLLSPILMPFVLGAALAYLGDPIVDRLEDRGLSRTAGVCVVFALFGGVGLTLTLILLPQLLEQITGLIRRLPSFLVWLQSDFLPKLGFDLSEDSRINADALKQLVKEHWRIDVMTDLIGPVTRSGTSMLAFFANVFMVPVVTFYLLRDWDVLVEHINHLIPRQVEPKVTQLAREADEVLGAFITGQLLVMSALGSFYALGLWIAGLELALLVGMMAGFVSFIPYLGPIVGVVVAGGAMMIQNPELMPLIAVMVVFGLGQVLESIWLTPWLVGDKVGLHPVAVIFAVMAGGQLFGFLGVMLGLPVASVLAVMLRHARAHWLESQWYKEGESLLPSDLDELDEKAQDEDKSQA